MRWPPEFGKVSMMLEDGFSRRFHYLRLSLTEACNFRCTYCLPDGYKPDGRKSFLTLEEIRRVSSTFAQLGVQKIRLTGGEPSMRRDLPAIIETVSQTNGIESVAMTTNGYRLKERAKIWYDAGLRDLNVSVDSLDARQFQLITGENKLASILEGIDIAQQVGYRKIKVNTVLLKNLNDHRITSYNVCYTKLLRAANALRLLGLDTHVIEFAPRLMPVQIDAVAGDMLKNKIESLGVQVHVDTGTDKIVDGEGALHRMMFKDGSHLETDVILFSAGIRPEDSLARQAGLAVGERGGIIVITSYSIHYTKLYEYLEQKRLQPID